MQRSWARQRALPARSARRRAISLIRMSSSRSASHMSVIRDAVRPSVDLEPRPAACQLARVHQWRRRRARENCFNDSLLSQRRHASPAHPGAAPAALVYHAAHKRLRSPRRSLVRAEAASLLSEQIVVACGLCKQHPELGILPLRRGNAEVSVMANCGQANRQHGDHGEDPLAVIGGGNRCRRPSAPISKSAPSQAAVAYNSQHA